MRATHINFRWLTEAGLGNVISGVAAPPASGTGANGEYYVSSKTGQMWGPKASGAWPVSPFVSDLVIPGYFACPVGVAGPDVWGTGSLSDSDTLNPFIETHRRVFLGVGPNTDAFATQGPTYRLDYNGHRPLTLPGRVHLEGLGAYFITFSMDDAARAIEWRNSYGSVNAFQANSDYGRFVVRDINVLVGSVLHGGDKTIGFDFGGLGVEYARDGQQAILGTVTISANSGNGVTCTSNNNVFMASDVGRKVLNKFWANGDSRNSVNAGEGTIVSVESLTSCTINITETFTGTTGGGPYTLPLPNFSGRPDAALTFSHRGDRLGVTQLVTVTSTVDVFKNTGQSDSLDYDSRFAYRIDTPKGMYHPYQRNTARELICYACIPDTDLNLVTGGVIATGDWKWNAYAAGLHCLTPARANLSNIKTGSFYIGQRHLSMQYSSGDGFESGGSPTGIGICFQSDTLGNGAVDVTTCTQRFFVSNVGIAYLFLNDGRDSWSNIDMNYSGGMWVKDGATTGFCFRHSTEALIARTAGPGSGPQIHTVIIEGGSDEYYNTTPYNTANDGKTYYWRDSFETWQTITADQAVYDIGPYWPVEIRSRRSAINGDIGYWGRLQGKYSRFRIKGDNQWATYTYGARCYDKDGTVEFIDPLQLQPWGLFENVALWPTCVDAGGASLSTPAAMSTGFAVGLCGPREGVYESSLEVDLHPNWNPLVPDFSDSDAQVTVTRDRDPNAGMGCTKLAWPNPVSTYKAHSRLFRGWSAADSNSNVLGCVYKISLANLESVAVRVIVYVSNSSKTYEFGADPSAYNGTLPEAFTLWPSEVSGRVVWQDIVIPLFGANATDRRFSIQILSPTAQTVNILATRLAVATGFRYDMARFNAVLRNGAWNYPKKVSA